MLRVIDKNWREHLQQLDALKSVIGMRAYGQRDPLNEYKSEAFTLFDGLLTSLRQDVTKDMMSELMQVQIRRQQMGQGQVQQTPVDPAQQQLEQARAGLAAMKQAQSAPPVSPPRAPMDMINQGGPLAATVAAGELPAGALDGISRNSACPCGSGRKVKHCHGKVS